MWGGRFSGKTDPIMEAFNSSITFDQRMAKEDLIGSIAYSRSLVRVGLITDKEGETLVNGLYAVLKEWESNSFIILPSDEDIHSANERRLGELVGSDVSGKLHTGRSRNDQVATDMRLWVKNQSKALLNILKDFISASIHRASQEIDVIFPGYTHLQRAQPIRWSHWILSYAWCLQADAIRLRQLIDRMDYLPLGSGALAGNPFSIDRDTLAKDLKFTKLMPNSVYGVSDRDFIAEFLFWASLTMIHLSRWAEDLIIYSSAEFGYVRLADAYSTGSSLMPQKKNPDSLELIRGKIGRVYGGLCGFLMTYKGLPSAYNKDLQEDKEPLFESVDTVSDCLKISTGVLSTLKIQPEKMKSALSSDMLATDLAEYLVRKGIPFRETHHIAGAAVKMAEKKGCSLSDLTLNDFQELHSSFEEDVHQVWDFERSVENRNAVGGTSKSSVIEQIEKLKDWLAIEIMD